MEFLSIPVVMAYRTWNAPYRGSSLGLKLSINIYLCVVIYTLT